MAEILVVTANPSFQTTRPSLSFAITLWSEFMSALSNQRLDDLILSFTRPEWRKVAIIIGKTLDASERRGVDTTDEAIAERVVALVKTGKLEFQGDLSLWRHSEVRLPD